MQNIQCRQYEMESESIPVQGLSPIELLPGEIVHKIIILVPEAVFELRLTSRLLRSRVDELAVRQSIAAIVEQVTIYGKENAIQIRVDMSKIISNFYELRLKSRFLNGVVTRSVYDSFNRYVLKTGEILRMEEQLMNLGASMGTRLEKLYLFDCVHVFPAVHALLKGIRLEKLIFKADTFCDEDWINLLSVVNDHDVEIVALNVGNSVSNPAKHLLELSTSIRSLYIHQFPVNDVDRSSPYFFGVFHAEWSEIFLKMFAGALDKLLIENNFCPDYLTKRCADQIIEKIPKLGKNIWFKSTCNAFPEREEYSVRDYLVQGGIIFSIFNANYRKMAP
ncbi:hypothetical protein PMAYCL1PPCAC_27800 [Pristionchus mayeri]|uniref:F-box domain-containing protein n=1 Tax=Pristionchus mayeri TaxID=1317129 RepID=A0AAN5D7R0_9BILA|nr:hypothetical protein PMAYCL1PPCAC_27800 [Pristionchus mayeri]